ncbi:uncharacterized protein LOC108631607 [Ceratina calcarata]|uniref:Uncharacterized protein LOC108631607 n=1 Tax=Ceratina calcarata TaxID=156304 RepID=A0AAJ7NEE9_9HYME|nr:uncharacterized protein LOC108631607 [Ceratina calcarata]
MNSLLDDDIFAPSDEDLLESSPTKCNPVKDHLMKQMSDIESRIEKKKAAIKEIQDVTQSTLECLYGQALCGEDKTGNFDKDLYDINGKPIMKKVKKNEEYLLDEPLPKYLFVGEIWKRVLSDKWVLGIPLKNCSQTTLTDVSIYVSSKESDELSGVSMIWEFADEAFWNRTNKIERGNDQERVPHATVVLDLPKFDRQSFYEVYGSILYEADEQKYQTPLPVTSLTIEDFINNSYKVDVSTDIVPLHTRSLESANWTATILTWKSTSVFRAVDLRVDQNPGRKEKLQRFLEQKSFQQICPTVYVARGCSIDCMIEILSPVKKEQTIRISTRSDQQMNVMLQLLNAEFPDIIINEVDDILRAAKTILEELKLYQRNACTAELQMARIGTDLLIP